VYQVKCDWENQRKEGGIEDGEAPNGNQYNDRHIESYMDSKA
jgi:hypothetical protein